MSAPTFATGDPSDPVPMPRQTAPNECDARCKLELLDRSAKWNARLRRTLQAYQAAAEGRPDLSSAWPGHARVCGAQCAAEASSDLESARKSDLLPGT